MKTPSCFYTIATVTLLIIAAGCGKKSEPDPQASTGPGSAMIKLTQNGQVITEFKTADAVGVGGGGYSVVISSANEEHNLTLSIDGDAPGTYPFITSTQPLTVGKANFLYQSRDLPEVYTGTDGILLPSAGQIVVKTATKTRCSGTFTGTGVNDKDGKTYTLEGAFDAPVF